MALIEFLHTKHTKEELKLCLKILQEFKGHESAEEWLLVPGYCWIKLEQFEDYLKLLTGIQADTVDDNTAKKYMADNNI